MTARIFSKETTEERFMATHIVVLARDYQTVGGVGECPRAASGGACTRDTAVSAADPGQRRDSQSNPVPSQPSKYL